ncbi:hypothetical protein BDQ17DRAFT_1539242 [Cyathus striatus]|nr:hypothetical protein BDQ17DRAFT_1539242 [Cyathus striatus]
MASGFPNINDLSSVKSLLEQLSASQAWQEVANSQADVQTSSSVEMAASRNHLQVPPAVLPEPAAPPIDVDANTGAGYIEEVYAPHDSEPVQHEDVKNYSFQKALPHIASLVENSVLLAEIRQLKIDQNRLEKQLWEERQAIFKKYEEKVNVAKNKAKLIGTGISKHEADMIKDSLKKEMAKFDQERALPSWDGLVAKQQTALENLGIPAMYATQDKTVRERQQRIIQVLEGVVGGEEG